MRKYESMLVFDPELTEEQAVKENQVFLDLVKSEGGEPLETAKWGKRKLAYEIKKKREGYYFVNNYNFDPQKIGELERHLRISEVVLRYNILSDND